MINKQHKFSYSSGMGIYNSMKIGLTMRRSMSGSLSGIAEVPYAGGGSGEVVGVGVVLGSRFASSLRESLATKSL